MLETINKSTQIVAIADTIALGSTNISDFADRIELSDAETIKLKTLGKYKVTGIFNVSNTTSSDTNVTISLYANGSVYGLPITVTVPATTGYAEIVIDKTVVVKPTTVGNVATIQFITSSGATVTGCQVDVFKRA